MLLGRCIEIYKHLLLKCFNNAAYGRQEMVQCKYFFWHMTERCSLKNLKSQKGFCLCCGSIMFSMSSELKFVKRIFFWPWDFLLGNLKLKKTLMMFTRTSRQTYKCFIREITIFKKMILNMRFRISFILIKISIFWGFLEGDLTSALSDSHVVGIFTAPPPLLLHLPPLPPTIARKGLPTVLLTHIISERLYLHFLL